MKTFLKRNRMIKLFTAGWIFMMFVISTVFLLGIPSADKVDAAAPLISGENKLEVTLIEVPLSTPMTQVVIVNSRYSMKAIVLTSMSWEVYKFEVLGVTDINGSHSNYDLDENNSAGIMTGNGEQFFHYNFLLPLYQKELQHEI